MDNHLSSLQWRKNNIVHLNQCLLLNIKKTQQCHIQKLNPSFLFDLHQGMFTNEHQYVTKMTLSASMGGLWKNFVTKIWIDEYLKKLICILNKISKHIISRCDMDFQSIPLHRIYIS